MPEQELQGPNSSTPHEAHAMAAPVSGGTG